MSYSFAGNRIGGVIVGRLASSVVDRGFKPWSGQTKDYCLLGNICGRFIFSIFMFHVILSLDHINLV